ncbi:MAG: hypothetical protein AAF078_14610, partial [Planctomycetota bacterium]
WEAADAEHQPVLALHTAGPPKSQPVRRPASVAIYEAARWPAATIDLELKSLEPVDLVGADACVILGYRDETHYTYIHLSNDADGRVHNVIMKVEGDTRRMIQTPVRPEPRLGEGWQSVRITYDATGAIAVYMNDLETPLMTAHDPDVPAGHVGVGSFNDRAAFAALRVDGQRLVDGPAN